MVTSRVEEAVKAKKDYKDELCTTQSGSQSIVVEKFND